MKIAYNDENFDIPYRVLPGKLSVSRTIGDPDAKLPELNGNPKVVIAVPDIKMFKISKDCDFIFIGCDGIFDVLNNKEISDIIIQKARKLSENIISNPKMLSKTNTDVKTQEINIHEICGECVNAVLEKAMEKGSYDNVTGVLIAFKGFKKLINSCNIQTEENNWLNTVEQQISAKNKKIISRQQNFLKQCSAGVLQKAKKSIMINPAIKIPQKILSTMHNSPKKMPINLSGIRKLLEFRKNNE